MRRPWPMLGGVVSGVVVIAATIWVVSARGSKHDGGEPTSTATPSTETCDALAVMEAESGALRSALREKFSDVSWFRPYTPAGWASLMRAEAVCDSDRMLAEDTVRYLSSMHGAGFDRWLLVEHSCGGGRPMEPTSDSEQEWSVFVAQSHKLITLLDEGEHDWRELVDHCYELAGAEPRHVTLKGLPSAVRN